MLSPQLPAVLAAQAQRALQAQCNARMVHAIGMAVRKSLRPRQVKTVAKVLSIIDDPREIIEGPRSWITDRRANIEDARSWVTDRLDPAGKQDPHVTATVEEALREIMQRRTVPPEAPRDALINSRTVRPEARPF